MAKIEVNGSHEHDLWRYLKSKKAGWNFGDPVFEYFNIAPRLLSKEIKWNYTKFLVDKNGEIIDRYGPDVFPDEMEKDIIELN